MKYRYLVLSGVLAAVVAAASAPLAGQASRPADKAAAPTKSWTQPKTPWGHPDLQGTWRGITRVNFERLKQFEGREFLTDEEVAASQAAAVKRTADLLAGTAEARGFRNFPLYNSSLGASEEIPKISKRTSAIIDPPDGKLPLWTRETVRFYEAKEAATRGRGEADTWQDRHTDERCIHTLDAPRVGNWGMSYGGVEGELAKRADIQVLGAEGPRTASAGPARRILQTKDYVAIVQEEEGGGTFIIPLDGRPKLSPKIRQWQGDTRGRWEGNTLVVEIANIKYDDADPYFPTYGFRRLYPGTGETLKVTERYTLVDAETIEYRYTVEDSVVYARPYTVLLDLTRDDAYAVSPLMCHENNWRNLGGQLAGARADEASALKYAEDSARLREPRLREIKAQVEAARNGSR